MARIGYLKPFGVDLFCTGKKFLIFNLVSRNLTIKYRRSILGVFWSLLVPVAMAGVYYLVFKLVMKIEIPHYVAFVLSGVLPWGFFSQTLSEGMEAIVGNWGLLSKVPIPVQVFPFVGAITNLVTLAIALPVLIGGSMLSSVDLGPSLIMLLLYFPMLFLIAYSLSLILAIGLVYFRDLRHILGIILQVWFYATPVIYDVSMIPPQFRIILYLNPVADIFLGLHDVLAKGIWPDPTSVMRASAWVCILVGVAALVHRKVAINLVERI